MSAIETTNIPELIKDWCARHNIPTLVAAARRLGVPYRTLQDWHLGNREPRGFARRSLIVRLSR